MQVDVSASELSGFTWDEREWQVRHRLGTGSFASVYEVVDVSPRVKTSEAAAAASSPGASSSTAPPSTAPPAGQPLMAAKVSSLAGLSSYARSQAQEEARIWSQMKHDHIIVMFGQLTTPEHLIVLLEIARGGELFDRITAMDCLVETDVSGRAPNSRPDG